VLLIDAGAKSTNLIFIEGKKIFIRSINTTGVGVTTAISKEYQVDYPTAEGYKTNSGCIALNGEYYAQWDEATGALASVITNAVTRLPSDITRTINYYRSQHGGSPPTKIFLAGGGSNLPYLKEFLEEKHSLPVEYFNPFNRIAVGPAVNQEALAGHAHQLGELVGLATTAAETSVLSIDLVPDSIMARREDAKKKPFFIASAAAVIVGSLVWAGTQFYNNAHAQKQIAKLDGEIQALQPFKRQLDKLNRDQKALDNKSADLSKLVMDRYTSVDRLDELRTYFTSEVVWLDSIQDLVSYEFVALKETPSVGESLLVSPSFETMTYGNSAVEEFSDKEAQVNAVMIKGFWRDNPQNQQVVYGILEKIKSAKESAFTFELDGKKLDDNMVLQIQSTIPTEQDKATFSMLLPLASPISIAQ